jgi:hypothetical protein
MPAWRRCGWLTLLVSLALLAAACGRADNNSKNSAASVTSTTRCPNPEGQACLGPIPAGRYTTKIFTPQLTYTVPAGWSNLEDTPGNFLLVPPGGHLEGVNAGTSDFIGVYTSVVPIAGCKSSPPPGVDITPPAFSRWLRNHPGFSATKAHPTTVGGLHGVVVDLRVVKGWKKTCPYSNGTPVVPLMAGRIPSGLDHNLIPGQATRLYLLAFDAGVLAIEVVDIKDAGHLDSYSQVVQDFSFNG